MISTFASRKSRYVDQIENTEYKMGAFGKFSGFLFSLVFAFVSASATALNVEVRFSLSLALLVTIL